MLLPLHLNLALPPLPPALQIILAPLEPTSCKSEMPQPAHNLQMPAMHAPSSEHTQVSHSNGLQLPPHDLHGPDNGDGRTQPKEPLPGTVLDTAGGDEDVVASPAEAVGKAAPPARRRDAQQPATAPELSELQPVCTAQSSFATHSACGGCFICAAPRILLYSAHLFLGADTDAPFEGARTHGRRRNWTAVVQWRWGSYLGAAWHFAQWFLSRLCSRAPGSMQVPASLSISAVLPRLQVLILSQASGGTGLRRALQL
jgi:hypothetical protein